MFAYNIKPRLATSLYYLALSLLLTAVAAIIIYGIWYPAPFAQAMGIDKLVLLMGLINCFVFPVVVFFIYKANKKELIRDILVLLLLQLSLLGYGLYIFEQGRPAYLVFAIDDFEVVRPADIAWANQQTALPLNQSLSQPIFARPQFVYSAFSTDTALKAKQQTEELTKGVAITFRADNYQPMAKAMSITKDKAKPLKLLSALNPPSQVQSILNNHSNAAGWLPLKAPNQDMVVLVDKSGRVIEVVDLRPYQS